MTEEIVNLLNGLDDNWKKFLSILEKSGQQLEGDKVCNVFVLVWYKTLLNSYLLFDLIM